MSHAELAGSDMALSFLETALTALRTRRMTPDQVDRFARLVNEAEEMALRRGTRND